MYSQLMQESHYAGHQTAGLKDPVSKMSFYELAKQGTECGVRPGNTHKPRAPMRQSACSSRHDIARHHASTDSCRGAHTDAHSQAGRLFCARLCTHAQEQAHMEGGAWGWLQPWMQLPAIIFSTFLTVLCANCIWRVGIHSEC